MSKLNDDYSIEAMQDVDCDYSKVDEKLTITVYMSRDQ